MNTDAMNEYTITDTHSAALFLIACALNRTAPDDSYMASVDQESLYKWAVSQNIHAMLGWILSQNDSGEMTARWKKAYTASVRRAMLFDAERANVLSLLEKHEIWYMPLKGILIRNLYPVYGMRQMADNDILFDPSRADDVKNIFINIGYECRSFDQTNHDIYFKKPYFSFEMHRLLFSKFSPYYEYYRRVKDRLLPDPDNKYSFHFSKEDFYIYIYIHFTKHLYRSGTGIRSLIDLYLYRLRNPDLDSSYISRELSRFDLDLEEAFIQTLARRLFSSPHPDVFSSLDLDEKNFLAQFLCNGTYGTIQNTVSNKLSKYQESSSLGRKLHYLKDRLLPDVEEKLPFYPAFFRKHKWALPLFLIYRFFNRLIVKREKVWKEIKALFRL